MIDRRLLLIFR